MKRESLILRDRPTSGRMGVELMSKGLRLCKRKVRDVRGSRLDSLNSVVYASPFDLIKLVYTRMPARKNNDSWLRYSSIQRKYALCIYSDLAVILRDLNRSVYLHLRQQSRVLAQRKGRRNKSSSSGVLRPTIECFPIGIATALHFPTGYLR